MVKKTKEQIRSEVNGIVWGIFRANGAKSDEEKVNAIVDLCMQELNEKDSLYEYLVNAYDNALNSFVMQKILDSCQIPVSKSNLNKIFLVKLFFFASPITLLRVDAANSVEAAEKGLKYCQENHISPSSVQATEFVSETLMDIYET